MHVHTQVYMCVYSGVHTCRAQRKALGVLVYYPLPHFIETKSLTDLELGCWLTRPSSPPLLVLGLQDCPWHLGFRAKIFKFVQQSNLTY